MLNMIAGASMKQAGTDIGTGVNLYQSYKAGQEEKKYKREYDKLLSERPKYKIQEEYGQNISDAKGIRAMFEPLTKTNTLPGQAYMQNRIDANAANTVAQGMSTGITSPSQLTQLLSMANKGQQGAQIDLSLAGAQARQANMANFANSNQAVMGANTAMAEEKDKEWNQNTWLPYDQKLNLTGNQWMDAMGRKRAKGDKAVDIYTSGLQSGGDSLMSFGMGKGGGAQGGAASTVSPQMEAATARYQGTEQTWQKRGRGF